MENINNIKRLRLILITQIWLISIHFHPIRNQRQFIFFIAPTMGFFKCLGEIVTKCDVFCESELLRFKKQPQYKTFFGGSMSILLIFVLFAAFSNKVIATLSMQSITSSRSSSMADDPIVFSLDTNVESDKRNFMMGVEIWHHNLNQGPRYFDIVLTNKDYEVGSETLDTIQYPLQQCTLDHWRGYDTVQKKFNILNADYWLCLPKDTKFQINGKYSSINSKTVEVSAKRCTNSSGLRPCASPQEIDAYFRQKEHKIFFTAYFTNPLLNPEQAQHLTYYLQDKNYIIFSQTGGEQAQLLMSDYQIVTDDSISPFEKLITQTGGIIQNGAIKNRYEIDENSTTYATFFIFKSPLSVKIVRGYQKLDDILSYIGGLFGTLVASLFVLKIYNGYSFQLVIGDILYRNQEKNQAQEGRQNHDSPDRIHDPKNKQAEHNKKKYTFISFITHILYGVFKSKLKTYNAWATARQNYKCRQQLLKQLDIVYLLRRIHFLQNAIQVVLTEDQITALHLTKKQSLEEAKNWRKKFKNQEEILEKSKRVLEDKKDENFDTKQDIIMKNFRKVTPSSSFLQNTQDTTLAQEKLHHPNDMKQSECSSSSEEDEVKVSSSDLDIVKVVNNIKAESKNSQISRKIFSNINKELKNIMISIEQQPGSDISQKKPNNGNQILYQENSQNKSLQQARSVEVIRKQLRNQQAQQFIFIDDKPVVPQRQFTFQMLSDSIENP